MSGECKEKQELVDNLFYLNREYDELLDDIGDREATDDELLELMIISHVIYEEENKGKPKWVKPDDLP